MSSPELVPLLVASSETGIPRKTLRARFEAGDIAGERIGERGTTGCRYMLDRLSLAAYVARCPACPVEDCGRPVAGRGPGCSRHYRRGKRHSEETKRKIGAAHQGRRYVTREARELTQTEAIDKLGTSWKTCREGLPHLRHRLEPRSGRRPPARVFREDQLEEDWATWRAGRPDIHEGHRRWRDETAAKRTAGRQLTPGEVAELAPDWRSPATVLDWIRRGLLSAADGGPKGYAVSERTARGFLEDWFREGNGRRQRWEDRRFHARWYERRHGSTRLWGRAGGQGRKRAAEKEPELAARVRELTSKGRTQQTVANTLGISRGKVRRLLAA